MILSALLQKKQQYRQNSSISILFPRVFTRGFSS